MVHSMTIQEILKVKCIFRNHNLAVIHNILPFLSNPHHKDETVLIKVYGLMVC